MISLCEGSHGKASLAAKQLSEAQKERENGNYYDNIWERFRCGLTAYIHTHTHTSYTHVSKMDHARTGEGASKELVREV